MLHAKTLFFVDNQQPKICDFDGFGQYGVGADDNINGPVCQSLTRQACLFSGNKAGQLAHTDRKPTKAFLKTLGVLTRQ